MIDDKIQIEYFYALSILCDNVYLIQIGKSILFSYTSLAILCDKVYLIQIGTSILFSYTSLGLVSSYYTDRSQIVNMCVKY